MKSMRGSETCDAAADNDESFLHFNRVFIHKFSEGSQRAVILSIRIGEAE